jgi:Exopolyphosphatase
MRIAVIDMGTNTFNLLVAEVDGRGSFKTLHQHKIGVMLGRGGINNHMINPDAFARGIDAIRAHRDVVLTLGADKVKAFATSAIRSASNGQEFVGEISKQFGIDVEVITGDREAELIYKGVNASMELGNQKVLIMDIGGGSNEFIICDSTGIYWKQSFPLGVSRLLERFTPSDPITNTEAVAVECYLSDGLEMLWKAIERFSPVALVGSSGSFDTFRSVLYPDSDVQATALELNREAYQKLHKTLMQSSVHQRRLMNGMEELRVEMIVLATILTNLVVQKSGVNTLWQSSYALKEGAVVELLTNIDAN